MKILFMESDLEKPMSTAEIVAFAFAKPQGEGKKSEIAAVTRDEIITLDQDQILLAIAYDEKFFPTSDHISHLLNSLADHSRDEEEPEPA